MDRHFVGNAGCVTVSCQTRTAGIQCPSDVFAVSAANGILLHSTIRDFRSQSQNWIASYRPH